DYQSLSQTVSWGHGDSATKTVYLTTNLDSLDELDETVYLVLQNPGGGAVLGIPVNATAIILDNDNAPSISLSPPSPSTANEGNSGTRVIYFSASLSSYSGKTITAGLNVSGSATPMED